MVHLRAENLPEKSVVKQWLFDSDLINEGQNFALVLTETGKEFVVKSPYQGMIVKTIKLGSEIKNGSILANIAIGEEEISKFKEKKEYIAKTIEFQNQQDGIVIKGVDAQVGQENNSLKNRFSEMRKNIAASIQNNPNAPKPLSEEQKRELANKSNTEAFHEADLFKKDAATGVSKFRQLINSRKEKLMDESDFKEVQDNNDINAMSKTDEKGRPLIMRNIIANRLEKFQNAGGDPSVLDKIKTDYTKEETKEKLKAKDILKGGKDKYILPEEETPDVYKAKKIVQGFVKDDVFLRQRSSDDGEFRPTFGAYVDNDDDEIIDANSLTNHGNLVMPKKDHNQLVKEIESKKNITYAESKIANLYDTSRRWQLLQSANQIDEIRKRRLETERKLRYGDDSNNPTKTLESKINGIEIPEVFLRESVYQDDDGSMKYVKYKDTPKGKKEFDKWLKISNLYSYYYKGEYDGEIETQEVQDIDKETGQTRTITITEPKPEISDKQMNQLEKLLEKIEVKQKAEDEAVAKRLAETTDKLLDTIKDQKESVNYLKSEIDFLKRQLDESKQKEYDFMLKSAQKESDKPKEESLLSGGSLSQMIQLMLIQNILQQTQNTYNGNNNSSVRETIQQQIDKLRKDLVKNKLIDSTDEQQEVINLDYTKLLQKQNKEILNNIGFNKHTNEQEHFEIEDTTKEQERAKEVLNHLYEESEMQVREKVDERSKKAVKSVILSQNYIPPLTISTEVDMTSVLKLKHVLKKTTSDFFFPSILFIAKALSLALEEYPRLNSSYDQETNEIIVKNYHNIGLATETNNGLVVPVLKFVEKLSLKELSVEIKEVTSRLREGKLYSNETSGSTITLANYGNIGAINATPTIFYPNAAVVGVGKITKRPVVVDNGKLAIKAIMNVSLTVDQRIIDSSTAGKFLEKMKAILEKPELLSIS